MGRDICICAVGREVVQRARYQRRGMAKALAPNVAVNCVAPGMIDLGDPKAASFMRRMKKQTPMQRNGTGEDVAAAVLFFAIAPQFITGQILWVDGGLGL